MDRVARTAGSLYLCLAVFGGLGFLLVRPQIFTAGNPAATLAALVEHGSLARAGLAFELLTVIAQALAAIWFYRLFRLTDQVAAGSIAAFGLVNAVVVLGSASLLGAAIEVAAQPFGDAGAMVQLLHIVSGQLWAVGGVFFGLWLVPMGWCALRAGMPRALGWVLIAGGAAYVVSAFGAGADWLVLPATVGEVWMIGYLLVKGAPVRSGDE